MHILLFASSGHGILAMIGNRSLQSGTMTLGKQPETSEGSARRSRVQLSKRAKPGESAIDAPFRSAR